jgi:mechanosensitive ion channel family
MDNINNLIANIKQIKAENLIDIAIALIVVILFFMVSNAVSYCIIKIFKIKSKNKNEIKGNAFYKPIRNIIRVTGIYVGLMLAKVPVTYQIGIVKLYKVAIIIFAANGFANIFNPKNSIYTKIQEKTGRKANKQVESYVSKIIKALIYVIAGYAVMLELGYNLGGLVTGLGISSVVIAFAAQDLAKNIFGGLAILIDKPFKIGDWVEIGEFSGTVTDISFRSTKLKAIDNTCITMQNSTIAESSIKNWGNIDKRRYNIVLNIPLETSKQTIEKLLKKIRFMLKTNKNVIEDSLQVHFKEIQEEGIKIEIYLNTPITDLTKYEDFRDEINLELIKILESENIKLAYPGQNIYINTINTDENTKKDIKDIVKTQK